MAQRRLIRPTRLLELFAAIEPAMVRYPAVDPSSFHDKVLRAVAEFSQ